MTLLDSSESHGRADRTLHRPRTDTKFPPSDRVAPGWSSAIVWFCRPPPAGGFPSFERHPGRCWLRRHNSAAGSGCGRDWRHSASFFCPLQRSVSEVLPLVELIQKMLKQRGSLAESAAEILRGELAGDVGDLQLVHRAVRELLKNDPLRRQSGSTSGGRSGLRRWRSR